MLKSLVFIRRQINRQINRIKLIKSKMIGKVYEALFLFSIINMDLFILLKYSFFKY